MSKDYRVKFSVSTQELGSLFGPKAWERMEGGWGEDKERMRRGWKEDGQGLECTVAVLVEIAQQCCNSQEFIYKVLRLKLE